MQVIKEASHYSMKMVVECDLSYNGRNETENKLSSDILIRWLLVHYFKIELVFEKLFLVDGKKSRKPTEKKNRRGIGENQSITNSTQMRHQIYEQKPGNSDGGELSHHYAISTSRRRIFLHLSQQ